VKNGPLIRQKTYKEKKKDCPSRNVKGFGKGLHTNSAIIFNSGGCSGDQIVCPGGFLHIEPPFVIGFSPALTSFNIL
jgi:hypothetical protein